MDRLLGQGFHIGATKNTGPDATPGTAVTHDTHLAVVDQEGRVRAYFSGLPDPNDDNPDQEYEKGLARLRREVAALRREGGPAEFFPPLNAALNAAAGVLLLLGYGGRPPPPLPGPRRVHAVGPGRLGGVPGVVSLFPPRPHARPAHAIHATNGPTPRNGWDTSTWPCSGRTQSWPPRRRRWRWSRPTWACATGWRGTWPSPAGRCRSGFTSPPPASSFTGCSTGSIEGRRPEAGDPPPASARPDRSRISRNAGASTYCQPFPSFQGPRASISPSSPSPVESLKYWSTSPGVGGILPIGERVFAQAFQRQHERLHVRDLARHQELQRVLAAGVVAEVDQPLVDDLGPGLGGDVAAQVHVQLAGDLQVVGRPGVALPSCTG